MYALNEICYNISGLIKKSDSMINIIQQKAYCYIIMIFFCCMKRQHKERYKS
jgi:hypothetical protein